MVMFWIFYVKELYLAAYRKLKIFIKEKHKNCKINVIGRFSSLCLPQHTLHIKSSFMIFPLYFWVLAYCSLCWASIDLTIVYQLQLYKINSWNLWLWLDFVLFGKRVTKKEMLKGSMNKRDHVWNITSVRCKGSFI